MANVPRLPGKTNSFHSLRSMGASQQLGIADTLRFLNQFSCGAGDYTTERQGWLDAFALDDIVGNTQESEIRPLLLEIGHGEQGLQTFEKRLH